MLFFLAKHEWGCERSPSATRDGVSDRHDELAVAENVGGEFQVEMTERAEVILENMPMVEKGFCGKSIMAGYTREGLYSGNSGKFPKPFPIWCGGEDRVKRVLGKDRS